MTFSFLTTELYKTCCAKRPVLLPSWPDNKYRLPEGKPLPRLSSKPGMPDGIILVIDLSADSFLESTFFESSFDTPNTELNFHHL